MQRRQLWHIEQLLVGSRATESPSEIQVNGLEFHKNKTAFLAIKAVTKRAGLGGNCYWMFLFWVKEPGRGNLWEKTGQRVCVHIPHVWPLTVPSVCSAVWWSNKSPDRPEIEEPGEPFSYKTGSLFIYLSRERNWTHVFLLSTPCYSFTRGSCLVQPQTFTDAHFTAACSSGSDDTCCRVVVF